jgi:hypothetical protein
VRGRDDVCSTGLREQEYGEAEIFRAWRAEGKLLTRADIGLVNSVSTRTPCLPLAA